jgi:hypothetical protein
VNTKWTSDGGEPYLRGCGATTDDDVDFPRLLSAATGPSLQAYQHPVRDKKE